MARIAPKELNLSAGEPEGACRQGRHRTELQKLVNRHNIVQQIVLRARIILLASEGKNHGEIARTLNQRFAT